MTGHWTKFPAIVVLIAITLTQHVFAKTSAKLIVDPPRGFYEQPFDATITSPVDGATITYTFDGTDPMTSPSAKSAASPAVVHIDPTNTTDRDKAPGVCLRAVAVLADTAASNLGTHTYLFVNHITDLSPDGKRPGADWPNPGAAANNQRMDYGMDAQVWNAAAYRDKMTAAMLAIPSMSLVMDLDGLFDAETGIYVNAVEHGREWERPCSLELLNPDGSDGFHINCGVRIRGGYSRVPNNPKHAFRFFFRAEYGEAKLKHALFEDEGVQEFDKIDLRTAQNYSWSYGGGSKVGGSERNTFLRDVFSRDLQRDMGRPYTRSRYYHLYINGTYWGLFQTQERSEASFAGAYFGGNREDWDAVKVDAGKSRPYTMEATDGNLDAYNSLWDACQEDMSAVALYYQLQGLNIDGTPNSNYPKLLDVDNLIDYMINSLFVGDFDAPISEFINNQRPNNFWALYHRTAPDGFKWFRHDGEHALFFIDENRTGPYPAGNQRQYFNPQYLHQELTANAEYRLRFADRVYEHFFNNGALTPEANIARLLKRKEQIDLAIIAESARWGDAQHHPPYTRDKEWQAEVDYLVDEYFPERTDVVLDQFIDQGWYPDFQPPEFNQRGGQVEKGFQTKLNAGSGDIYYTTNGVDPHNPLAAGGLRAVSLISWSAAKRALVPQKAVSLSWRRSLFFDDSDWDLCTGSPGGVGYERGDGYQSWITLDVGKYMRQDESASPNPSCYIRIPFTVNADDAQQISRLMLTLRYDDGFIVYLNGEQVAEMNAPEAPAWNSFATQNHEAESIEKFNLTPYLDKLNSGDNLLAVQALNVSLTSSDFLLMAELIGGIVEESGDLVAADAVKYTSPIVINKTTHIKTRLLKNGQWSALNEATFAVEEDLSALRLTELHYHPLPEIVGCCAARRLLPALLQRRAF